MRSGRGIRRVLAARHRKVNLEMSNRLDLTPRTLDGKPDAGKPPVRFDEGRSKTVIGLQASQSIASRLLYTPTPSL